MCSFGASSRSPVERITWPSLRLHGRFYLMEGPFLNCFVSHKNPKSPKPVELSPTGSRLIGLWLSKTDLASMQCRDAKGGCDFSYKERGHGASGPKPQTKPQTLILRGRIVWEWGQANAECLIGGQYGKISLYDFEIPSKPWPG